MLEALLWFMVVFVGLVFLVMGMTLVVLIIDEVRVETRIVLNKIRERRSRKRKD